MSSIDASTLLGAGADGYQIERSLRFSSASSKYLNRTPASAGNRKTWTWSAWVKRAGRNASYGQRLYSARPSLGTYTQWSFRTSADDQFELEANGGTYLRTTMVFRDFSAWYHIAIAVDTTQATSSDRIKLYVNGVQVTAFASSTYPSLNADTSVNDSVIHNIGRDPYDAQYYFDGYMTEVHLVDGQALTPSSFGETDTITGVWKPKKYTGTYGTNGFKLTFSDNSGTTSTTLGKDSSGNGNNWTPNNFSVTAGAGNDSMIDVPTPYTDGGNGRGNYATLNPVSGYSVTLTNGNLDYVTGTSANPVTSTYSLPTTGKWYWEVTVSSVGEAMIGIQGRSNLAYGGAKTVYYRAGGSSNGIYIEGTANSYNPSSYTNGDVIGVAFDATNSQITWYKNNTQQGGPFSLTSLTDLTPIIIQASGAGSNSGSINFGQRPFAYTPPSGFLALNTQNLPEPTIKKPSSYFNTVLFTGNTSTAGVTQAITGVGFAPDLVWVKTRNQAFGHYLYDAVRGVGSSGKLLQSNNTNAESTNGEMNSLDADGFTVKYTDTNTLNWSSSNNVAWCWDESATPGFDIVTYTGDGTTSANRLIDHSLGVKPDFVVTKKRSSGTDYGWSCWHKDLGGNYGIWLDKTSARNSGMWTGYSNFSATKFTPPDLLYGNENGATYVNYLWSEVAGFSKFGSYTGNGSSDGPFVFCGFRPRWVMVKRTDTGGYDWEIYDSARADSNVIGNRLWANLSTAENSATRIDFLSNGFKIRDSGGQVNGGTIVFAAFAESPAKYSLAR